MRGSGCAGVSVLALARVDGSPEGGVTNGQRRQRAMDVVVGTCCLSIGFWVLGPVLCVCLQVEEKKILHCYYWRCRRRRRRRRRRVSGCIQRNSGIWEVRGVALGNTGTQRPVSNNEIWEYWVLVLDASRFFFPTCERLKM